MGADDIARAAAAAWRLAAEADGRVAALAGMALWFVLERIVSLAVSPVRKVVGIATFCLLTALGGAFVADGASMATGDTPPFSQLTRKRSIRLGLSAGSAVLTTIAA